MKNEYNLIATTAFGLESLVKREVEQQLYDLGLSDYAALKDKLAQFLNDSQSH